MCMLLYYMHIICMCTVSRLCLVGGGGGGVPRFVRSEVKRPQVIW